MNSFKMKQSVKYLLLVVPLILATLVLGTQWGLPEVGRMFLVTLEIVFGLWLMSRSCEACGSWFTFRYRSEPSYDSHRKGWHYSYVRSCLRCKYNAVDLRFSRENPKVGDLPKYS